MKYIFTLIVLALVVTSCSVTESIVFNEHMGGTYKTNFDFSQMMAMASQSGMDTAEKAISKPIDTSIVFNDFIGEFKDSIATLPLDKQKQLNAMNGIIIDMQMDESKSIFNFTMNKPFENFDELKQVNEQLDGAMSIAESFGKGDSTVGTSQEQMNELIKTDPIIYSFANNTFTRFQPKKDASLETLEGEESAESTEDMLDNFKMQFEDMFQAAFYTMTYTFPKPIKSVSNKNAILSADRKTMTLKTNFNDINKDETLMNLEVILED